MTYAPKTPAEKLMLVIAKAIDEATGGWLETGTARDSAVVVSACLMMAQAAMLDIDAAFALRVTTDRGAS